MTPIEIKDAVVAACMLVVGIPLTGIIQAIKNLLNLKDIPAKILAAVCSIGSTFAALKFLNEFSILALIIYSVIVFGEVTGLYDLWRDPAKIT